LGETDIKPRIEPRRIGQFSRPRRPLAVRRIKVEYRAGENVATRQAFGRALEKLGALNPDIVALDGDVKNSTGAENFAKKYPERFFECFIAEQRMVGTARGMAVH